MLSLKVYRCAPANGKPKCHVYLLTSKIVNDYIVYGGGGRSSFDSAKIDACCRNIPSAELVRTKLHHKMKYERVWRVPIQNHDELVAELQKSFPRFEVVPKPVLDHIINPRPKIVVTIGQIAQKLRSEELG